MTTTWDPRAEARRMDLLRLQEQQKWVTPDVESGRCKPRFWSKFMVEEGVVGDFLDIEFSVKPNTAPGLDLILPHDTQFYDLLFNNPDGVDAMIPLTVDTPGYRWTGKVTVAREIRDENGITTIHVEAIHDWQHVATTCLWASPWAPLLAQFPRHDTKFGPIASIATSWMATNVARQQGYWPPPEDWSGAPEEWADYGAGMWPIAVVPIDTRFDTSMWGAGSARFDMADQFLTPLLKDAGQMLDVSMFLPEEDDQPAPEWFFLDKPTIVVRVVNKSEVTGATGTALDGITQWFEDFLDDGVTPVRYPMFDAVETEYEDAYSTAALGSKHRFPTWWYFDGEYSGIGEAEIAVHKPAATDIYVGGRSPSYINALIEITIKNMLAWLGTLIGVPGLDSLYRGQLSDVFLAFAMARDSGRVQRAGPYAWRDSFVTGSEKAFTLDGLMALRQGLWDSRGYTSHKVTVEDNAPFIVGLHFGPMDQLGFRIGEYIFTDYVSELLYKESREIAGVWTITIGDGADEEDPLTRAWGRLGQVMNTISIVTKDVGGDSGADFFGLF